jgi:para-aminobenzoate synthetase component 1
LSYDLGRHLERVRTEAASPPARQDHALPLICFGVFPHAAVFDHQRGTLWFAGLTEGFDAAFSRATLRLGRPTRFERSRGHAPGSVTTPLASSFEPRGYRAAVEQARELIAQGDLFEVNLSQRFELSGPSLPDPLTVHQQLRRASPAPFAAFAKLPGGAALVSSSPERFVCGRGRAVEARPIKGTRPRGATPEEDGRLARELVASAKDQAELAMIVDLLRNDLGRVAAPGSVQVVRAAEPLRFAAVHHLVGHVRAELAEGRGAVDVIRAAFPCGSITGAPKPRAMEVIESIEPVRRGLYTGSLGYVSLCGDFDFNVLIRTIVFEAGTVRFSVGGAVTSRSDPHAEHEETLVKGRALAAALNATLEPGRQEQPPLVWDRGEVLPADDATLPLPSRAALHGVGLFETIRVVDRRAPLADRHRARLLGSSATLGLAFKGLERELTLATEALLEQAPAQGEAVLKWVLTRGGPGNQPRPRVLACLEQERRLPKGARTCGVRLFVCMSQTHGAGPTTRHKTLPRSNWSRALREARAEDAYDALLLDPQGHVVEGAITNVFRVRGGCLSTPPLDLGALPGVMRGLVLEVAASLRLEVREERFPLAALLAADEVFVTNALVGALAVRAVGHGTFAAPGPVTARVCEALALRLRT